MAIFLLILKIIGIILAVIAGIIVFIIASPVYYKTEADYHGKLNARARMGWLLGLLRANVLYAQGGQAHIIVKILFFTIYDSQKSKGGKKKKKPRTKKASAVMRKKKTVNASVRRSDDPDHIKRLSSSGSEGGKTKKAKKKTSILERIKNTFSGIVKKVKNIAVWLDEDHRRLYGFLMDNVIKILRKVRPKKFSFKGAGGTGDPYWTGRILSAAGVIIGICGIPGVEFEPDFENKRFEADMKASGYFFILPIALIALKIYRNKDFKRIVLKKDLPVEE